MLGLMLRQSPLIRTSTASGVRRNCPHRFFSTSGGSTTNSSSSSAAAAAEGTTAATTQATQIMLLLAPLILVSRRALRQQQSRLPTTKQPSSIGCWQRRNNNSPLTKSRGRANWCTPFTWPAASLGPTPRPGSWRRTSGCGSSCWRTDRRGS